MSKCPRYFIGIDAGVRTGLAVWESASRKWITVETTTFWEVYRYVVTTYSTDAATVVIENPALNRPTFDHRTGGSRKREKISRNVGANAREATLLIEGFRAHGFTVIEVRPRRAKITDPDIFASYTGITRRCSQHARDAAMLIVGRS